MLWRRAIFWSVARALPQAAVACRLTSLWRTHHLTARLSNASCETQFGAGNTINLQLNDEDFYDGAALPTPLTAPAVAAAPLRLMRERYGCACLAAKAARRCVFTADITKYESADAAGCKSRDQLAYRFGVMNREVTLDGAALWRRANCQ